MKFFKVLIINFILSIVCLHTGVTAWVYTNYSTPLKTLRGVTVQAEKRKLPQMNKFLLLIK